MLLQLLYVNVTPATTCKHIRVYLSVTPATICRIPKSLPK